MHPELAKAISMLNVGDVVIEVGSHRGDGVRAMENAGARVYAIEPDPENFKHLPHGYNVAISNESKSATLYSFSKADRCSTLFKGVQKTKNEKATAIEVPVMLLDDFMKKHAIRNVKLIRFDCYGSEYKIFDSTNLRFLKRTEMVLITMHRKSVFDTLKKQRRHIENVLIAHNFAMIDGNPISHKKHIRQLWEKQNAD